MTLGSLVEYTQTRLPIVAGRLPARRKNPDDVASRYPINVISGPDIVLIRNYFGQRYLILGRDFGH